MRIKLIAFGKTKEKFLEEDIGKYLKRLKHYHPFDFIIIPVIK